MNAAYEAISDWDIIEDKIELGSGLLDNFGYNLPTSNNYQLYDSIHQQDQNRVGAETGFITSDSVAD